MAKTGPRVLYWDIESSLMPVAVFQLSKNDWIDPSNILQERYIITASWMWEGESKVHSVSVLDDPKRYKRNPHDDFHVVKVLHEVLSQADIIIHHNGDYFDLRYVRTRALAHRLKPMPPVTTVDTYKIAKSQFMCASNKLDYLGKLLGVGRKIKTEPGLWMRVLNGDAKAVKEMIPYNVQDVLLLRDIYKKLRPYTRNHPNLEIYGIDGCPYCGSEHVQSRGTGVVKSDGIHKAISRTYRRFQCQAPECGGWFRATVSEKTIRPKYRTL